METSCCNFNLVIDFDSTFIKLEALDELAGIALENDPAKEEKKQRIVEITNKGMVGEISFPESLQSRLELFSVRKEHIDELIEKLEKNISESFLKNREFFKQNSKNIFIISGGFLDYILPIVEKFGIPKENVLANEFVFDGDAVVGVNMDNFLAQEGGKVKAVKELNLAKVTVVGDGWTDYEIKKSGNADRFIAFSENVSRKKVVDVSDLECFSFDEVIDDLR